MAPARGETQRMGMLLKWGLALATVLVGSAGISGGVYTAKSTALSKDEISATVQQAMADQFEKQRIANESEMKGLRAEVSDLRGRVRQGESIMAMMQSEWIPRLERLESQTTQTGKDVAFMRGLLERKQ